MRGRMVGGAVALLLLCGAGTALALPINQTQSGYSSQSTCLSWYVTSGPKPGSISLCGTIYQYGGTFVSRNVHAQRTVQTCDGTGHCTDAYSESYSGDATNTEFSMDAVAGTASFNITLAGEGAASCTVHAAAQATDSYTYTDPYPSAVEYGNPSYPYVQVHQGDTTYTARAYTNPAYPAAQLSQQQTSSISRAASGSGTVCNWVETQSPSSAGSMWQYGSSTTTYTVMPTP